MLNRKMHTIKKGGYTLFLDKIRKMLLAVGMSLLSICTFSNVVFATPTGEVTWKDFEEYTLYQVSAKETGNFTLEKISVVTEDKEEAQEVEDKDKLFWKMSSDGKELLAVIKAPNEPKVTSIQVSNSDKKESSQEGEDSFCKINIADNNKYPDGKPKITWAYRNEESNYVEFGANDKIVISELVGKDGRKINIEEKDKGTDIVAKYVLNEGDTEVHVKNIFGGEEVLNVGDIKTIHTIAAKNTDGQKVVLNITLAEDAELKSLNTVGGKNILETATKNLKGGEDKDLVAIYTGVPEGTTYLDLVYKQGEEEKIIPVALKLDLKAPTVVQRDADGKKVDANGTARVYKNETGTKALVEVTDMISGIVKIAVYKDTNECTEATQKFDINNLPTSVLQLMDIPSGATSIKIVDGIGNIKNINLDDIEIDNGAGLTLDMVQDEEEKIIATYQDNKAGLYKFVRTNKDNAFERVIRSEYEKNFAPKKEEVDDLYQSIQTKQDIEEKYDVHENTSELEKKDWQGAPEFTALSVLGNAEEFNINDIMFKVDSIYMATSGDEDDPVVKAMVVKAHDSRRIKKITADINGEEKTLDTFEVGTVAIPKEDAPAGPIDIDRVYELPEGSHVTKITFYHYNGDVTQNEIPVDLSAEAGEGEEESPIIKIPEVVEPSEGEPGEEPIEDPRTEHVTVITGGGSMGKIGHDGSHEADVVTTAKIKYGIKKVEYSDGCVLEFYEDLPKEVEVYTKDNNGNPLAHVYITDGLGYVYDVADGSGDIAKFSPEGEGE